MARWGAAIGFAKHRASVAPSHQPDLAARTRTQTLMAHGTLLSDDDIRFLASKRVSVSHCPLSNFFLGDACFK